MAEPPDPGIKAVNILCPKVSQKQKATEIGSVLQSLVAKQGTANMSFFLTSPRSHQSSCITFTDSVWIQTQKMETEHRVWAIITKYRGRQLIPADAADITKERHS